MVYSDGDGRDGIAIAVDADSTGDISKNVKWQVSVEKGLSGFGSPVCVNGTLYRYVAGGGAPIARNSDEKTPLIGKLYCVDWATGKVINVLDMPGCHPWVSPVATADGLIYYATGGKSYVIKAGQSPEIVGTSDLGDENPSSPAAVDGKLIIRGATTLWCIGKP